MDRFQLITDEAVRIARDYPELSYKNAIEKAKEIFMRKAYRKNALDGIDEYITRDDRQELPEEDVFMIELYECEGIFGTYEEALDHFINHTTLPKKYPDDYIYKIKEVE